MLLKFSCVWFVYLPYPSTCDPQCTFLPQCERTSFTPIQNNNMPASEGLILLYIFFLRKMHETFQILTVAEGERIELNFRFVQEQKVEYSWMI